MELRNKHRKKKWQKPEFKTLKFSQTYQGTIFVEDAEGDYTAPS